jgi:iron complex outermembrane receptor protein
MLPPDPVDKPDVTLIRFLPFCLLGSVAWAQHVGSPTDDLDKISVDELFSLQVTSVGRKAQQLSKAPAAVFVMTAEDIRRTGATSIPEVLQWVPGLTVQRVDGRSWVISARGSARLFADKILVMIDGRSLYTPLFAGVFWDAVDVPLGLIERIEVVRGPGAVMWGPNAVNGVINIITRKAQDTKGGQFTLSTGNELRGAAQASWGAAPNDRIAYRVWGQTEYRTPAYGSPGLYYFDTFAASAPSIKNLDSTTGRFGFRVDAQSGEKNQWMVQGDVYKLGRHDPDGFPLVQPEVDFAGMHSGYTGGSIQARWTKTTAAGKESVLQFSFSKDQADYGFVGGDLNNLTLDYQNRRQTGERNELYWGAGYQQYWDSSYFVRFFGFQSSPHALYRSGYMVVRDEWQIVPGKLLGSVGVRTDYSPFHKIEYQPSLRLLYTPQARQSAWLAISRAVRIPSRVDRDLNYDNGAFLLDGLPVSLPSSGSVRMRSETERGAEVGYRIQAAQRWSADISLFWNEYSNLRVVQLPLEPVLTFAGDQPLLSMPGLSANAGWGRTYGGEVWGTWQVRPRWRLTPSYSYLRELRWLPDSQTVFYMWERLAEDLRQQGAVRSQHDLLPNLHLVIMLRLRSRDLAYAVPGSVLLDARLGWRVTRSSELSLTLKNLTDRNVLETYPEPPFTSIPLRRTLVVKWSQRF